MEARRAEQLPLTTLGELWGRKLYHNELGKKRVSGIGYAGGFSRRRYDVVNGVGSATARYTARMAMHATTVRFTGDLWELLEHEAAAQGISVAQFVRDAALMRVTTVMSKRGDADGDATLARLAAAATSRVSGPPAAVCDPHRLQAVRSSGLLDSPAEERFDRLTRVAAHALNAPVALITVVEDDRQFLKSSVGLPEPWHSKREMPLSHSFCQHGVGCADPLVVTDARNHPLLRDSAAIADLAAIAYLGVPLRTGDGYELGAICVIDHRRRDWSTKEIAVLRDIADSVEQEIQLERPSVPASG